jgi:hypothetical protein
MTSLLSHKTAPATLPRITSFITSQMALLKLREACSDGIRGASMKTLTERILRTFPAFHRHKTILDMRLVLAPGLIAPIIGQLARRLGDEKTTCMGYRSRNFEYPLPSATHGRHCRRIPSIGLRMDLKREDIYGHARSGRAAHVSCTLRAILSRSLKLANHEPGRFSKECRR